MSYEETFNPTEEFLQGALINLEYEIMMLKYVAHILAIENRGKDVIYNALLESFLIHARILIDFLYRDDPYKNTVRAAQYFTCDNPWESIRPMETEMITEARQDAHKHLDNLTYNHLHIKIHWPYEEIANEVEAVLQVFIENLPTNYRKPNIASVNLQ